MVDENEMWQSGALGEKDAETLQNTVWFVLSKNLGFRGCQEARQLCYGDLEKKTDNKGNTYLEWTEKISKTRQGQGSTRPFNPKLFRNKDDESRCPVRLVTEFLNHRPVNMCEPDSPFFLQVNRNRNKNDHVWYKCQPLGVNTLFMKRIVKKANLEGENRKLTNHSIRKTSCSRLLEAGVPPTAVAQLSGHKRVDSLNMYNTLNIRQQEAMAKVLASKTEETVHCLPGERKLSIASKTEETPSGTVCIPSEKIPEKDTVSKPVIFNITIVELELSRLFMGINPQFLA